MLGKWKQSGHSVFPAVLNQIPNTGAAYLKKKIRALERLPAKQYIKISGTKNWRETCSERGVIFFNECVLPFLQTRISVSWI